MRIATLYAGIAVAVAATAPGCVSPRGTRLVLPEDLLLYQPSGPPPEAWRPPGLVYEDVYFESSDGVPLHGWYCPVEHPAAVVLFAHGNAGNVAFRYPDLIRFNERLNASILVFDYRGYGHSGGSPSESGLYSDARAARTYLAKREGISEQEIVLFGRSLGGAVAIHLAAADGARGLIVESTFTSAPAVANDTLPLRPGVLMRAKFDSINKIGAYRGPLLVAHGSADEIVPFDHATQLLAAANEPKQLVAINGARHAWTPTESYLQTLDAFLRGLPDTPPTDRR